VLFLVVVAPPHGTLDHDEGPGADQYCVSPTCSCENSLLSFLRLPTDTGSTKIDGAKAPAVFYAYRSGEIDKVAKRSSRPTLDVLIDALKRAPPTLDAELDLHAATEVTGGTPRLTGGTGRPG